MSRLTACRSALQHGQHDDVLRVTKGKKSMERFIFRLVIKVGGQGLGSWRCFKQHHRWSPEALGAFATFLIKPFKCLGCSVGWPYRQQMITCRVKYDAWMREWKNEVSWSLPVTSSLLRSYLWPFPVHCKRFIHSEERRNVRMWVYEDGGFQFSCALNSPFQHCLFPLFPESLNMANQAALIFLLL